MTTAPSRIDRPDAVPPPTGIRSVSPVMSFTCPYSTPNHSAMS